MRSVSLMTLPAWSSLSRFDAVISSHEKSPPDYTLKFVMVGEVAVGKSSILDVLAGVKLDNNREPTVGIEFNMLRGVGDPVNPMSALGSAIITSPIPANEAMIPAIVGFVNNEICRSPA